VVGFDREPDRRYMRRSRCRDRRPSIAYLRMSHEDATRHLAQLLGDRKGPFIAAVQQKIDSAIAASSVADCLTMIERRPAGDLVRRPEATIDYIRCLAAFCSNKSPSDSSLDSGLSDPVVRIVVKEFEQFYDVNSDRVASLLTRILTEDRVFMTSLVETIIDTTRKDIPAAIRGRIAAVVVHRIEQSLHVNLGTMAGHAVSAATTKVVAAAVSLPIAHTTALLIAKFMALHLKVVLTKVLASAAVKAMIAASIKKMVVGAIIAALIKLVGAKLTIGAGAAFALVIVPLMLAFLAYEAVHLPKRLGDKVSHKVAAELDGSFESVSINILSEVLSQIGRTGATVLASQIALEPEVHHALGHLIEEASHWGAPSAN